MEQENQRVLDSCLAYIDFNLQPGNNIAISSQS